MFNTNEKISWRQVKHRRATGKENKSSEDRLERLITTGTEGDLKRLRGMQKWRKWVDGRKRSKAKTYKGGKSPPSCSE